MSEQVIQQDMKFSSFKKFFFYFKVNRALIDCKNIENYLLDNDYLSKLDSKLNLIISDGFSNEVKISYFLVKALNTDVSIPPIRKYTLIDGEISKCINVIKRDIIVIDLFDESIYLHSYSKNNRYIIGYLIKEEVPSEINKTLIFSNEKVKIAVKYIYKSDTINVVDDFVNAFIM